MKQTIAIVALISCLVSLAQAQDKKSVVDTVPVDFKVPMTTEQAAGITEKLTLTLAAQKENMKNVTLRISWGRLQLMAPLQVLLDD